jgi:uncharacterized protein (DUF58 family)
MTISKATTSEETPLRALNGFPMLLVNLVLVSAAPIALAVTTQPRPHALIFFASEPTLRDSADEVAHELAQELQKRLAIAGIQVEEARLTHLAYAPEIAPVMLRRQQAETIISCSAAIRTLRRSSIQAPCTPKP